MYLRFVSSEIDETSHVSAGPFCAAFKLLDEYEDEVQVLAQPFADMRFRL